MLLWTEPFLGSLGVCVGDIPRMDNTFFSAFKDFLLQYKGPAPRDTSGTGTIMDTHWESSVPCTL